ncbi:MAG: MFS transporter [Acidobacteria bacterium]|nr:MFS transporter [Acidobacteriota bacterium]
MFLKRSQIDPALLAVVAEGFLSRLSFGIIGFALPLYAHHLGMSLSEIGLLVSLNTAVEIGLKPLMAPAADRFGLKRSLSAAIGVRSIVGLLLAMASVPWQLFVIRMLHGASESMRDPSVSAIIAERGGKKTVASAFAWYTTAKNVAGSVGKAFAGILLTATSSNYNIVFLAGFALSALPLYVVFRYLKDARSAQTPAHNRSVLIPQPQPESGIPPGMRRPPILRFFGLGVLVSGTAAMLSNLFPVLATQYAGLSEAETGIIYAISTTGIIVAGPLFGWLSDNVSRKLVLAMRSIANTLSSLLYITFPSFAGVATAKVVDDMGKAAFRPAWGALMAEISSFDRAKRARTIGYLSLGENIGEVSGPILTGFLWHTWGVTVVLITRAVLAVLTELYSVFLVTPEGDRASTSGTCEAHPDQRAVGVGAERGEIERSGDP